MIWTQQKIFKECIFLTNTRFYLLPASLSHLVLITGQATQRILKFQSWQYLVFLLLIFTPLRLWSWRWATSDHAKQLSVQYCNISVHHPRREHRVVYSAWIGVDLRPYQWDEYILYLYIFHFSLGYRVGRIFCFGQLVHFPSLAVRTGESFLAITYHIISSSINYVLSKLSS